LEILKRAKGFQSGEGVSWTESAESVREEALRRSAKAGYTTRDGNPINATKISSPGIGESKINVWPRDKHGNLIGD